jgi:hypothetical protein
MRAAVIGRQGGYCPCGRPATQVHHVRGPGDDTVLLGLCEACHNRVHGKETRT